MFDVWVKFTRSDTIYHYVSKTNPAEPLIRNYIYFEDESGKYVHINAHNIDVIEVKKIEYLMEVK